MERAKVLFGCYRRGDANDPDQYVASIAAVLTLYEPSLVREVTDPRGGISTDEKYCDYMPNSGQLKVYCDSVRDRHARYDRWGKMPKPQRYERIPDRSPGRRANVCVYRDAPQYPAMFERTQSLDADPADWKMDEGGNLWVSLAWFDVLRIGKWTRPKFRPDNDTKIEAEEMRDDIDIQEEVSCTES